MSNSWDRSAFQPVKPVSKTRLLCININIYISVYKNLLEGVPMRAPNFFVPVFVQDLVSDSKASSD